MDVGPNVKNIHDIIEDTDYFNDRSRLSVKHGLYKMLLLCHLLTDLEKLNIIEFSINI